MRTVRTTTFWAFLGGFSLLLLSLLAYPHASLGQSTSSVEEGDQETTTTSTSPQQVSPLSEGESPEIVAYGDSLVEGRGVSGQDSFPGQLDRLMGGEYEITNAGNSGDTTEELLDELESRVLSENPDMVILFGGGADIVPKVDPERSRLPPEETFSNLEEIISELQDEDIVVVLMGHGSYDVPGFTYVDYTDEFRDLANDTDVYFAPDVMGNTGLEPEYTNEDLIHPNARGYSLITLEVFPVLQEAIHEEFSRAPLSGSCQVSLDNQDDRPELVFDDEETVMTNQEVEWIAYAVGGYGNYRYDWEVNDTDQQSGQEITTIFESEGSKEAQFTVESSGDSEEDEELEKTIQCEQTIEVETAPLKGSCTVDMDIEEDEVDIDWDAEISGGETGDEYEYEWQVNNNVVSTSSSFSNTYDRDKVGDKSATLIVESGPRDASLTCETRIPGQDEANATNTLESVSCDVNGFDYEVGDHIEWSVDASPDHQENEAGEHIATTTVEWSGSGGLSTSTDTADIAYETPGVKTATADINAATGESTFVSCEAKIVPNTDGENRGDGEGCFIATAAYGTALANEIDVLREFRDNVLLEFSLGRTLVEAYYSVSPPIANIIEKNKVLQSATRSLLRPVVSTTKLAFQY